MNIVDSIGVMLGGDSRPFDKMMEEAGKRLDSFDKRMSAWSAKMSIYVSAPLMAVGTRNVFLFAEQEKAIMGLQAQLGKVSAKPFVDFSNELQNALGKDDDAMVALMSRFASMGVEAGKLKRTTVNALGLSAATGMGEFQAFRAMQMLKQGQTMLFARYIPGLARMSRDEQFEKVSELINRGLAKMRAESMGVAGSFRAMKLAMDDTAKASGDMISRQLHLPEMFRRLQGFAMQLESRIRGLPESTQKWIVYLGTALALVGPISFALTKAYNIMGSLIGAAITFGRTLFTTALPAILAIGAAFLGWELLKTLSDVQVGLYTIGQWTELTVLNMMKAWEKYFAYIRAGFRAATAEEELAKAYGLEPNKFKKAAATHPLLGWAMGAAGVSVYDPIIETRTEKQDRYDMMRGPYEAAVAMAKMFYEADPTEQNASDLDRALFALSSNSELRQLAEEIARMSQGGASDAVIAAKEKEFEKMQDENLNFFKPGREGARIEDQYAETLNDAMERFAQDGGGITNGKEFWEKLRQNIVDDSTGALAAIKEWFDKTFPAFVPAELKTDGADKDDFDFMGRGGGKSYAAALLEGTQEAYSLIYGNESQQEKLLRASERSAMATEETVSLLQQLLGGGAGDASVSSGAFAF